MVGRMFVLIWLTKNIKTQGRNEMKECENHKKQAETPFFKNKNDTKRKCFSHPNGNKIVINKSLNRLE